MSDTPAFLGYHSCWQKVYGIGWFRLDWVGVSSAYAFVCACPSRFRLGYTQKLDSVVAYRANYADQRQDSARGNFCAGKTELCTIALDQSLINNRMLNKHSLLLHERPTWHHNLDLTMIFIIMMMIKIFNLELRDCIVVLSYP